MRPGLSLLGLIIGLIFSTMPEVAFAQPFTVTVEAPGL